MGQNFFLITNIYLYIFLEIPFLQLRLYNRVLHSSIYDVVNSWAQVKDTRNALDIFSTLSSKRPFSIIFDASKIYLVYYQISLYWAVSFNSYIWTFPIFETIFLNKKTVKCRGNNETG